MMRHLLSVLALAAAQALAAQTPQSCPWLNAGTATQILGADVTATVHADSNWSGSCTFAVKSDSKRSIAIDVGKMDTHACGSQGKPLAGIGNEAMYCAQRDGKGGETQMVTGRVRGAWFVIKMPARAASGGDPASPAEGSVPAFLEFVAEQVAGNLY